MPNTATPLSNTVNLGANQNLKLRQCSFVLELRPEAPHVHLVNLKILPAGSYEPRRCADRLIPATFPNTVDWSTCQDDDGNRRVVQSCFVLPHFFVSKWIGLSRLHVYIQVCHSFLSFILSSDQSLMHGARSADRCPGPSGRRTPLEANSMDLDPFDPSECARNSHYYTSAASPTSFQHSLIGPAIKDCSPDQVQPLGGYLRQPFTHDVQMHDGHNLHRHILHPLSDGSGPGTGSAFDYPPYNNQQYFSTFHHGGDPSPYRLTYQPVHITQHPLPVLSMPATGMSTWHPAQAVHTVNNGGQVHPFHQSVEAITQRPLPTHSVPATGMSTCPPTQFVHAVDSGRAPPFHQSAQTVHRGLPPPPISHVVSHDTATVEENTSRTIMAMNSRSLVTPSSFVGHYDAFRRVQDANPPQGTSETPRTALVRPQSRSQVPAVLMDYGLPRSETYHTNGQVTSSCQLPNVAHIPYSTPEHHTVLGTSAPPMAIQATNSTADRSRGSQVIHLSSCQPSSSGPSRQVGCVRLYI